MVGVIGPGLSVGSMGMDRVNSPFFLLWSAIAYTIAAEREMQAWRNVLLICALVRLQLAAAAKWKDERRRRRVVEGGRRRNWQTAASWAVLQPIPTCSG